MTALLGGGRGRAAAPAWAVVVAAVLVAICVPTGVSAQSVARVEVAGRAVFSVASVEGSTAAARAAAISDVLEARIASDLPLTPIRVVQVDTSAALVIGADTLLRVTPRDAEVELARPIAPGGAARASRQVARTWAAALQEVFLGSVLQERARVVVQGTPLFEIGGTPGLRAARRAEAVGTRIAELAALEPAPELEVVAQPDGGAVVRAGSLVLVEVSAAEAAVRNTTAPELAQSWAADIDRAADALRQRSSWGYRLRLLVIAAAALLMAVVAGVLLRRAARRIEARAEAVSGPAYGLLPVLALWGVSVVQFLVAAATVVFLLWLIPNTRSLTYAISNQALELLAAGGAWLLGAGLVVVGIAVGVYFVARFAGAVVHQLIRVFGERHGGRVQLRAETLASTVAGVAQLGVWFLGLIAVLTYLDVNPMGLLASAGVAGIAIGFGVQSLIRDFFTGLFILLEDQYGVGDLIQVGPTAGKVERFTLRITQIRSLDGSLTSIPNGEILTVTNLSKDWSQVVLDVNIKLGENVDRAIEVIGEAASVLTREWGDRIQGEPEVLGVETVDPLQEAVTIRVVVKTAPLERWTVSRELRRRILDAFRSENIQVPPRAVVTATSQPPPGSS